MNLEFTGLRLHEDKMVGTRTSVQEQQRRFHKLLVEILLLPDNSPIIQAFNHENIETINDVLNIRDTDIELLEYVRENKENETTELCKLTRGHHSWIRVLIHFIEHLELQSENQLEEVTFDDFNEYRFHIYKPNANPSSSNYSSNKTPENKTSNHDGDSFKRGTKRDKSQYPILKYDWQWDNWNRTTVSTAKTHLCHEVFDTSYVPKTKEEKSRFEAKQEFIYSVFQEKLQTDIGKHLVRLYYGTTDARQIYKELLEHAKVSTHASLESSNLLAYITNVRVHKISWKGTYHSFILHWCDKLRLYEELIPIEDHFTDNIKMNMLQNTVMGIKALDNIKDLQNHDKVRGIQPHTYSAYLNLLLSAATTLDAQRGLTNRRNNFYQDTKKLSINETTIDYGSGEELHNIDSYLINEMEINSEKDKPNNMDTTMIHKNDSTSRPFINGPKMSRDKWRSLSRQEQQNWDTFSNRSKGIILGIMEPSPSTTRYQTNLHDISAADYLMMLHQSNINTHLYNNNELPDTPQDNNITELVPQENSNDKLIAFLTNQHPGDIRNVLSSEPTNNETTTSKSQHKRKINSTITYHISNIVAACNGSLVDRGANGGLAGSDIRIICYHEPPKFINVSGINSHQVKDLPIVTAGGVVSSQRGEVIIILHQYAYIGKGNSIHSCLQLEAYKNHVDDKSIHHGGKQIITTIENYIHPLDFVNGLPYIALRPYTDEEWETLPHVIWTSDTPWDPSSFDHNITHKPDWYKTHDQVPEDNNERLFDEHGNYQPNEDEMIDINISDIIVQQHQSYMYNFKTDQVNIKHTPPDYDKLAPYLLHSNTEVIRNTLNATSQYYRTTPNSLQLRQTFKTPFPACNVLRRNEPVATDTVYSSTPAIDDGSTLAQIFVGRNTMVVDIYPIRTQKEFIATLQDNIRERGAMELLISDRAKVEISRECHDILRAYCIKDWQSEPYYQHQNFAERKYAQIKPLVNRILNTTGAPPSLWLLALQHVARTLNHLANKTLKWITPLEKLTGRKPDISSIIIYRFWEKIYYKHIDAEFPHNSSEKLGRFVGVADTVGHALTFKILSDESKIIFRSKIRSADRTTLKNRILEPIEDDDILKSKFDREGPLPTFDPQDLIGRTFLREPNDEGIRYRAKIIEILQDHEDNRTNDIRFIKFRCSVNDDQFEEIVTYIDIVNHLEKEDDDQTGSDREWKFKSIIGHEGPLSKDDPEYKGSRYNVLINWETAPPTYEPLDLIARDDPVTCGIYGEKHHLLEQPGWKRFKRIMNRKHTFNRMINQIKSQKSQQPMEENIQFGVNVPRNHKHAMDLDSKNGNNKWYKAEQAELKQIFEYETFIDKGKGYTMPPEYTRINVHFVYAVKHDGRHKARLVAGGHLTKAPTESIYSGVVSLKGIRLIIFLGRLNGLNIYSTDIGNAYLEAKTQEKVYIVAGPEFGPLEGHTLMINKALYGLRSSGLRWHEKLADSLRDMGFQASKAEDDIWMRRNGEIYEYIASYVDDLCIVAKEPSHIIRQLEQRHKYKLKGTGPIKYHLGCDYYIDAFGDMAYAPKKYIEKLILDYVVMYGSKPKQYSSPLESGDHPELDTSKELDQHEIKKYQSMIGSLQWAISLGRFDICTAVMTLSSFRASPRIGHLKRAQRIYGYLAKFNDSAIRIRVQQPDYSKIEVKDYDWQHTVYGKVEEIIPKDVPTPLGNKVILTTYVDANLYHDMITGRSVSGILHLINKTPFEWYSKKQSTIETATYGSEYTAARIAVDHIVNHRNMLRYMGVPIEKISYLFGDNKSVVDSSSIPHAKLHKRHNALSYHRVREAIASKILAFIYIPGQINPADILSKHWGYQQVKDTIKALLFHKGNTLELFD